MSYSALMNITAHLIKFTLASNNFTFNKCLVRIHTGLFIALLFQKEEKYIWWIQNQPIFSKNWRCLITYDNILFKKILCEKLKRLNITKISTTLFNLNLLVKKKLFEFLDVFFLTRVHLVQQLTQFPKDNVYLLQK